MREFDVKNDPKIETNITKCLERTTVNKTKNAKNSVLPISYHLCQTTNSWLLNDAITQVLVFPTRQLTPN